MHPKPETDYPLMAALAILAIDDEDTPQPLQEIQSRLAEVLINPERKETEDGKEGVARSKNNKFGHQ